MELTEELRRRLQTEQSVFQGQLLREDIARLERLETLFSECSNLESFRKEGFHIGWTQGDFRTHELKEPLDALLEAVHARLSRGEDEETPRRLREAWAAFERFRMEKLVGCL